MRQRSRSFLLLASCVLCGCQSLSDQWGTRPGPKTPVQKTAPIVGEPVLYARDGSVVSPGASSPSGGIPRRDVQGGEGSRAKILELYQRVVDERDRLQLTLTERESELAAARKQLDTETARAKELEEKARTAELSSSQLSDQNLELAGRLAMAQIRRLEAEKQWLELSLSLPSKTVAASMNAPASTEREKTDPPSPKSAPGIKAVEKSTVKKP